MKEEIYLIDLVYESLLLLHLAVERELKSFWGEKLFNNSEKVFFSNSFQKCDLFQTAGYNLRYV